MIETAETEGAFFTVFFFKSSTGMKRVKLGVGRDRKTKVCD